MRKYKILSFVLVLTLLLTVFIMPVHAEAQKNETIYGILDFDGSVINVYVVNQLLADYTDYGEYTEIKNLSSDSVPVIDGDRITFPDEQIKGGLYYQGTIEKELPMIFDVRYYLDGKQADARIIGGSSGHLRIEIDYYINENCDERLTEGIIAQITVKLNMDLASNIDYHDGSGVVVGSTMNVSYTSLFEDSGSAVLEADVADFEMDSISISLLKGVFSLDEYKTTIDEFKDGFSDMQDGAGELVDGTSELKTGIESITGGVKRLSSGLSDIVDAGQQMQQGNSAYADGLKEFADGASNLAASSADISDGLDELAANGSAVSYGISQANDALASMTSSSLDLKLLAQSLLSSSDPNVQALAAGTLEALSAAESISGGLSAANAGLGEYTAGVSQMAASYIGFDGGLAQLAQNSSALHVNFEQISTGFNAYLVGITESSKGLSSLYSSIKDLPDDIQLLIDGQTEFYNGISEAGDELNAETEVFNTSGSVVSFSSPDKNNPSSVQYVLITPAIEKAEDTTEDQTEEIQQNFFTRVADLFR